ncbi:MAG: PadR family transcriptional regulator [Candidatus Geothermincolia bacterium]
MSTREMILGLIKKKPIHGYVLKKHYEEFVNPDKKLNDAKLYPLLRKMEEEGLVTRQTENVAVGPSRKTISATDKGIEAFDEWMASDQGEGFSPRPRFGFFRAYPFLTKFTFFYNLDDATALRKIEGQIPMHEARLDDYREARKRMVEKGLEACKLQAIDFGIMHEETILRWLRQVADSYAKPAGKARKRARARA